MELSEQTGCLHLHSESYLVVLTSFSPLLSRIRCRPPRSVSLRQLSSFTNGAETLIDLSCHSSMYLRQLPVNILRITQLRKVRSTDVVLDRRQRTWPTNM